MISLCCATAVFAQDEQTNAEISKLAKENAQAYCECPHIHLLFSLSEELGEKKLTIEEYKENGKFAIAQIAECTQPFAKKIQALTIEEYEFFSKEAQKYRLEFCAVAVEKYKQSK